MADKTDVEKTAEAANASALNSMAELQKMGFGSLNRMGTAWLENMSDIGSELMSFLGSGLIV